MNNKVPIKRILLFLVALLAVAAVFLPVPYYIEGPGTTENLKNFIKVDGQEDQQSGAFYLTTVSIRQATGLRALQAYFNSYEDIVSREELMGTSTSEEYNQIQRYYMESSQNMAIEQALKLAKKPYEMTYKGVYVMSLQPNSAFNGKLKVGDTVTGVDGQTFKDSASFMEYVKKQKVGQTVTVSYLRDGKTAEASGKLVELAGEKKPGIGISLVDHTEVDSSVPIQVDAGSIGGPSAGLMFTLEIYSQLMNQDLRKGHEIAGTGTMSSDGTVGRIGGIDKKIVTANNEGAEIFFAPDDTITDEMRQAEPGIESNYETAKKTAEKIDSKMKIVPVKTVQDALYYLNNLN